MGQIDGVLDLVLGASLCGAALLILASYVDVNRLVRYTSYPWSYRLGRSWDLDFQSVAYTTLHTSVPTRLAHAVLLPTEVLAWTVVLSSVHPALLGWVGLGVVGVAWMSGERPFAAFAAVGWGMFAAAALLLPAELGPWSTVTVAKVLLVAGPWLRVAAHGPEPIPPFVGAPEDRFVHPSEARVGARLPVVMVLAALSELVSALPFRVPLAQLYWLAQRLGYRPRGLAWADAKAIGAQIRAGGWGAAPLTAGPLTSLPPS